MSDLFPDTVNGHLSEPEFIEQNGVRYIREDLAHPQVKKADYSGFDNFWASIPKGRKNGSKANAKKAWGKLSMDDKIDAHGRVVAFYSLTKEERLGAQEMHVSTYLNSRCWEDEAVINKKVLSEMPKIDPLETAERNIKSGKSFLCTSISTSVVNELLRQQRVTKQQLRIVGL